MICKIHLHADKAKGRSQGRASVHRNSLCTWEHVPGKTQPHPGGGCRAQVDRLRCHLPFSPTACITSEYVFIKMMVLEFFLFDQSSNLSFRLGKKPKNQCIKTQYVRGKYHNHKKHRGFLGQ